MTVQAATGERAARIEIVRAANECVLEGACVDAATYTAPERAVREAMQALAREGELPRGREP